MPLQMEYNNCSKPIIISIMIYEQLVPIITIAFVTKCQTSISKPRKSDLLMHEYK